MPLPDAAVAQIAANLARLKLDPVLNLKIAAAVVAPLLSLDVTPEAKAPPDKPAAEKPRGARGRFSSPPTRKRNRAKSPLERARAAFAKYPHLTAHELCARARCGAEIAKKAMGANGADNEPKPRSLSAAVPTRDPDERARAYLEDALERGPASCADVDAEVDAGRLSSVSVERVIRDLDLVAVRCTSGKGTTAHYVTRAQAAKMDARVPPPGERDFTHRQAQGNCRELTARGRCGQERTTYPQKPANLSSAR